MRAAFRRSVQAAKRDDDLGGHAARARDRPAWRVSTASASVDDSQGRRCRSCGRGSRPPRRQYRESRSGGQGRPPRRVSLAAFKAAGAPPPAAQRLRAPGRAPGSASGSGASKVSGPMAARSSRGAGQGSRSGQAKAQAIGARMSGGPSWARVEPSSYSTRLWMIDCGWTRTSIFAPAAWRTDRRPRSSRGPCSSWSRNRPKSWRPCDQLGWATACSGVAAAISLAASRCGTARRRRSGSAARRRWAACRAAAPGRWPSARNRPGSPPRPPPWRVRSSAGPAQTRLSLLARRRSRPARAAARVGARPAAPTMAAITQSAPPPAASTIAAAPAAASTPEPASRVLAARRSRPRRRSPRRCGPPAPRLLGQQGDVAAAGQGHDLDLRRAEARPGRAGPGSRPRPSRWSPGR